MTIDGYLDDASGERLLLSNEADFDRVDAERAASDAILVGAETVRRDDPRLVVRSPLRRAERAARGRPPTPAKVTVTETGRLDPGARFFTTGDAERLVFCSSASAAGTRARLGHVSTVVDAGAEPTLAGVMEHLYQRGTRRLLVEGGRRVLTQLLVGGLADELQLVVAPFFVGDRRAPRLVDDGTFPWRSGHRADLAEVRQIGDVALLRYALSARFAQVPQSGAPSRAEVVP
jgi:5-amino-6-(5-phosphoribosylamino)uracil reductase